MIDEGTIDASSQKILFHLIRNIIHLNSVERYSTSNILTTAHQSINHLQILSYAKY